MKFIKNALMIFGAIAIFSVLSIGYIALVDSAKAPQIDTPKNALPQGSSTATDSPGTAKKDDSKSDQKDKFVPESDTDLAAALQISSHQSMNHEEGSMKQIFDFSKWRRMEGANPETGESKHGYFADDMFGVADYLDNPNAYDDDILKAASQIQLYYAYGQLNGWLNVVGDDIDFDYSSVGMGAAPFVRMNIAFDLANGTHRYMKVVAYEGEKGGLIFDLMSNPELLANIMTTSKMHVYVPIQGSREDRELLFNNSSFRSLLSAADQKVIIDAVRENSPSDHP